MENLTTVKFIIKLLAKRYAEKKFGHNFPVQNQTSQTVFSDYLQLFSPRTIMQDSSLKDEIYKIGEFVNDVVSDRLKMSPDETIDLALKIDCNAFNMDGGFAISPELCFFNHSCSPNSAKWQVDNITTIIALEDIKKEEEVTIPYIRLDSTNARRKKHLKQFCFECECPNNKKNCNDDFVKKHSCVYCQYDIMIPTGSNIRTCPECNQTAEII
jgi:hypothetical protein